MTYLQTAAIVEALLSISVSLHSAVAAGVFAIAATLFLGAVIKEGKSQ